MASLVLLPRKDVLRVWEREIPKPDFAVHHAAKVGLCSVLSCDTLAVFPSSFRSVFLFGCAVQAVRLLPKVNFTGMPPKHPVLMNLLKRTKVWSMCQQF